MRLILLSSVLVAASTVAAQGYKPPSPPQKLVYAKNNTTNTTWKGVERNGVETFFGIPFGLDTSGENRFAPPRTAEVASNKEYDATTAGPACVQPLGGWSKPLTLGNVTKVSEDCLNLNIWRPTSNNTMPVGSTGMKVIVWIHGGSLWQGSNTEPSTDPSNLILSGISHGHKPILGDTGKSQVMVVAMNYRLGVFGFAKGKHLKDQKSENAGLRDQHLAIQWVKDNIKAFGGDPGWIYVAGQGSGALSATMQHLAYGGTKLIPIAGLIAQSGTLEPGITGKYTDDAMKTVLDNAKCKGNVSDPAVFKCLRDLPYDKLLNASIPTYKIDSAHNLGDVWLPSVDGDFLPSAPSQLIKEGKFSDSRDRNAYLIGWTENDLPAPNHKVQTDEDVFKELRAYLPGILGNTENLLNIMNHYHVSEFQATQHFSAQYFRLSRILRDITVVCPSLNFAQAANAHPRPNTARSPVYLYHFNATLLGPVLNNLYNLNASEGGELGAIRTSEIPYTFSNLAAYASAYPSISPSSNGTFSVYDTDLAMRVSYSWASLAATGSPTVQGTPSLQGWNAAYLRNGTKPTVPGSFDPTPWINNTGLYVIGGAPEGLSAMDGFWAFEGMARQKLRERCGVFNSEKWIRFLQY